MRGGWRTKQLVRHGTFAQFVAAKPMEGLGADVELLKRICAEDKEALDLIDQATQGEHGGDRKSERINVDNINIDPRPTGTSRQHALRKLRKDRPDLHAQVLAKKLSPHAAMVKAGYRKRTFTIQTDPVIAAQYLLTIVINLLPTGNIVMHAHARMIMRVREHEGCESRKLKLWLWGEGCRAARTGFRRGATGCDHWLSHLCHGLSNLCL